MADLVLVHGAWHGAWCWRRVVAPLWAAGHRAFALTLTGVGDRAHLRSDAVTLATHVDDVVAAIEAEELAAPILVGHSYAGMVITGVADRLANRLRHLVYLDAIVPRPGESWSSTQPAEVRAERRRVIAATGTLPPPDPAIFGLAGTDRDWAARRQTPHPGGCYDAPLAFDAVRVAALPRTFVDCTAPALPTIAVARERVRRDPGWQVVELATGHDAMISAPQAVVDLLTRIAGTS